MNFANSPRRIGFFTFLLDARSSVIYIDFRRYVRSQNLPKMCQKSIKKRCLIYNALCDRCWGQFWEVLGGSLGRQNLSYSGCRSGPVLVIFPYLIFSYLTLCWISWKSLSSWVILGHTTAAKFRGLGPTGLLREYPPRGLPRAIFEPNMGPRPFKIPSGSDFASFFPKQSLLLCGSYCV